MSPITNSDLQTRRMNAVPRGVGSATTIHAARAENAELWDVEGRRYIDFAGGIAVLNVGHRHPKVMEAVRRQLDLFTHTAFQVAPYESYIALAERLNALAPFPGPAKTILFSTGAEATENAVKIARAATGRNGVIAFTGGFHGRTLLASAMTGKVNPYKTPFGSLPPDVYHVPFPAGDVSVDDSLKALGFLFAADLDPSRVAAIIIEPVQGEGGFRVAPTGLLRALRDICDTHGIVLIADEVQTGFARTGSLFGIALSGVAPDLVCVAKSLGGGFPLSGVIGRAALMDAVGPGGLGGTYAGAPIACAAALAVLDVIEEEGLVERANAIGARIRARLEALRGRTDLLPFGAPRGPGAMIGFDILDHRDGTAVRHGGAAAVCARAAELGLILLSCGVHGETIRILVPLTAPDSQIDEGLAIIEQALAA
ncbi:4-aminobutyrate--2-oxoglutarate transaminase [Gluconacetobacter johannae]|uniref:4-aminobutyrate--2-oxoglutarate transaminase n=1 Tax=Gluconacetobacter johannae TaxID=112140 RepID=A0A7W4P2B5_9PROT|nr:4-aminobutyrate--2-oxoglutarate transaminase [Gluconacetobacter johannae]MBB2174971.1 4-aminobutyrate--2-oxoglutarate transaminase [Gluconacetobacter johannae]